MLQSPIRLAPGAIEHARQQVREARRAGIQLVSDDLGRYFATSADSPGIAYQVAPYDCECLDFLTCGQCLHQAAIISALGWLREEPAPVLVRPVLIDIQHTRGHFHIRRDALGPLVSTVETSTSLLVNGIERVRIEAEPYGVRVTGLPSIDLTRDMPAGMPHLPAVLHWIAYFGAHGATISIANPLNESHQRAA